MVRLLQTWPALRDACIVPLALLAIAVARATPPAVAQAYDADVDEYILDGAAAEAAGDSAATEPDAPPAGNAAEAPAEPAAPQAADGEAGEQPEDTTVAVEQTTVVAVQEAAVVIDLEVPQPAPLDANPFVGQFLPALKTELSFANRACQFSPEQRQQLVAPARQWLDAYAVTYARNQGQANGGGAWQLVRDFLGADAGQPPKPEDPRQAIENFVAGVVRKIASPEQLARFEDEVAHRRDFQKQVIVENVVAKIDERLLLTDDQRREITAGLLKTYDDSWSIPLYNLLQMGEYLPQVADEPVVKHLTPKQRKVWSTIQKISFGHQGFVDELQWIGGAQVIDDVDVGEAPQQEGAAFLAAPAMIAD